MQNGLVNRKEAHNDGIDLLRIAAMLMVTAHHFSLHSGISFDPESVEGTIMAVLALGGKTGVNIFVLITGFYSSGKIRREKVVNLFACTSFYSLMLTLAAILARSVGFSRKLLLKASLPLFFGDTYWFLVTYLELYILIPLLNQMLENMEERAFRVYLACFTGLLCVLPSVIGKFIHVNDLGYNSLVWFIYLYCLGSFLRKYCGAGKYFGCVLLGAMLIQAASCIILQCCTVNGFLRKILECMADANANAVCPLLIAVSMLMVFRNMNICRGNHLIRLLGSATLGVYLFHDNVNFRGLLWSRVYHWVCQIGIGSFACIALLCVVGVFALGTAVELSRRFAVEILRKLFVRER